jgi:ferric-dicitrate binding protein FerR (iron transport regulator)
MSMFRDSLPVSPNSDDRLEQATQWFLRVGSEVARAEDLSEFKRWIDSDPRNELAYRQVAAAWAGIGAHAAAPEMMVARRNALDDARRAASRRWLVREWFSHHLMLAASICVVLMGTALYFYLQQGVYSTGIAEQRALRLEDGSLVTMDAKSRVRVAPVIELTAGQGLQVRANGSATIVPKIDVQQATAWQSGRLFFDNESLASAAERVNRYSRLQIEVDPSVANVAVSGSFTAGDANAFVEAIAAYFPVQVERTGASDIFLTAED